MDEEKKLTETITIRIHPFLKNFLQEEADARAEIVEGIDLSTHIRSILVKYHRQKTLNEGDEIDE